MLAWRQKLRGIANDEDKAWQMAQMVGWRIIQSLALGFFIGLLVGITIGVLFGIWMGNPYVSV